MQAKLEHPENFTFCQRRSRNKLLRGRESFELDIQCYEGSVFRLRLAGRRFGASDSQAVLTPPRKARPRSSQPFELRLDARATLAVTGPREKVLLQGVPERSIGVCGSAWLLNFAAKQSQRFFGMGEKWGSLEKSGTRTRFWNTNVWGSYPQASYTSAEVDPVYVSIPYLIVKHHSTYLGILVENPDAVFMAARAHFDVRTGIDRPPTNRPRQRGQSSKGSSFFLGAPSGALSLYFLVGPSLAELTRKLQLLVGTTPRPPLWALGHHQSRWGYRSASDLATLDRKFIEHGIPNDGLWLDIDYMRGFRVFTLERKHFPNPQRDLAALHERRRHIIPILDPGVKRESGYFVYDQGVRDNHFCLTPEGQPFVGFVWPEATHFPDFSLKTVRTWWAGHVSRFAKLGFDGFWIDMNDPATGPVDARSMRFDRGRKPHASYHNQYALGMAQATRAGLEQAYPERRPFVISRSAHTSIARYAAVWTGDNFSNEAHLLRAIPTSLNLALSGVPFNGHDVPGFGGNATEDLAIRWYKAAFLFPFLRNHTCEHTRSQEPWAFSHKALRIIRHFIRLRYKLLPYLYNLFLAQEARGEAIMRPLFYDFEDTNNLCLAQIEDQFMLGPAILHAPCLKAAEKRRTVTLPGARWYDAIEGRWRRGGGRIAVDDGPETTPLFFREGSVVPMQRGERHSQLNDLSDVELHAFVGNRSSIFSYEFDEAEGYGYRQGQTTQLKFSIARRPGCLQLNVLEAHVGYKPCRIRVVSYDSDETLEVRGKGIEKSLKLNKARVRLVGGLLEVRQSQSFRVG